MIIEIYSKGNVEIYEIDSTCERILIDTDYTVGGLHKVWGFNNDSQIQSKFIREEKDLVFYA